MAAPHFNDYPHVESNCLCATCQIRYYSDLAAATLPSFDLGNPAVKQYWTSILDRAIIEGHCQLIDKWFAHTRAQARHWPQSDIWRSAINDNCEQCMRLFCGLQTYNSVEMLEAIAIVGHINLAIIWLQWLALRNRNLIPLDPTIDNALHLAIENNHPTMVELLIAYIDPSIESIDGQTALEHARAVSPECLAVVRHHLGR